MANTTRFTARDSELPQRSSLERAMNDSAIPGFPRVLLMRIVANHGERRGLSSDLLILSPKICGRQLTTQVSCITLRTSFVRDSHFECSGRAWHASLQNRVGAIRCFTFSFSHWLASLSSTHVSRFAMIRTAWIPGGICSASVMREWWVEIGLTGLERCLFLSTLRAGLFETTGQAIHRSSVLPIAINGHL